MWNLFAEVGLLEVFILAGPNTYRKYTLSSFRIGILTLKLYIVSKTYYITIKEVPNKYDTTRARGNNNNTIRNKYYGFKSNLFRFNSNNKGLGS